MARRVTTATDPWFREAAIATGLDPEDTLTLPEVVALIGLSLRTVERYAGRGRLRTHKVANRRVTTRAWLRAWVEVWYPEHAGRVP